LVEDERWCLQLPGVGDVAIEAALTIGNADPGVEDEGGALLRYNSRVERCHRVHQWIFDELPYLVRQLSVFYQQAYLGIP
jgi:hypothetical protein